MCFVPGVMSVLSVGKVAGAVSPCLFVLCTVSINWGAKRRLGFGSSVGVEFPLELGVTSDAGFTAWFRLDLTVVSTGSGANRLFGFSVAVSFAVLESLSSALLLLTVVSTGSTANRRLLFTEVSTGCGRNLFTGAFAVGSDILS